MSKTIQLDIFKTYHKNVKIDLKVPEHLKGNKLIAHIKSPIITQQIEDAINEAQLRDGNTDLHFMDVKRAEGGYIK